MSTLTTEIQSLSPSAIIELFTLDSSNIVGGGIMRFHAGTNGLLLPVWWMGIKYDPLPIEAEGFDMTTQGTLPRPRVRVANVDGMLSAAVAASDDLVGSKFTRQRTFVKYLDAVNFPLGVNPDASTLQHFHDDVWYVEQKLGENRYVIEWELASAFDLQGVTLPARQVIQNTCTWQYKGPECNYAGTPFDENDAPCAANLDFCSKRLNSCRVRHPGIELPYGAYPGSVRYA